MYYKFKIKILHYHINGYNFMANMKKIILDLGETFMIK